MIAIKLLGSLLLLTSGVWIAIYEIRIGQTRISILDAWIELIEGVRTEIDCYLRPIHEILIHYPPDRLCACAAGKAGNTLHALLQGALPYLDRDTRRLLSAFVKEAGDSYREDQLKRCDFYLLALRKKRDALAAASPAKIKLCITLSLCGAIGTALLLW
ncbi:MAG: hypothetical protein E7666_02940 [Ruminococcaceae bacterium]|nr:hypothetical protein [Oscillospiraceae bacterium]